MNATLQQLKDIHLPSEINWWPIAPGLMITFILLLLIISYFIYFCYQRNKQKKAIKFALAKFKKLKELNTHNPDNINIAAELSHLIRRVSLYYFPREKIAGLTGKAWLDFLNQSGNTTAFTGEISTLLTDAPYAKNVTADLTHLLLLTESWLMTIANKQRPYMEK